MISLKTRRKISKDEMDPGATKPSNCQQYNFGKYKSWNHLRQDSSTIQSPWSPYEEVLHLGNTVNPGDVCGSSVASAPPSIYNTVDRSKPINGYIGFPPAPRENLEHHTLRDPDASSHKRTSSSSSIVASTRGVKRSCREPNNNLEDHMDIYSDRQIAKQEREDGHPQCPFSRCDAD